ncbi:MAG: acyltransferase [Pirellulaceae bacterium]
METSSGVFRDNQKTQSLRPPFALNNEFMQSSAKPSELLQDAFRTIGLWATVLVVLIHYRTANAIEDGVSGALQELLVNGIGRVAVPLFAFMSGYLYFRSGTDSWEDYRGKLAQRSRTVMLPYLLISLVAFSCWGIMQCLTKQPTALSASQIASRLMLHPMAEQLWFLRDLIILVLIAPLIRAAVRHAEKSMLFVLILLWTFELQPAPIVSQWYLLNVETLLFFTLGCVAVRRNAWLERLVRLPGGVAGGILAAWLCLVLVRVAIDPTFDLWYVRRFTLTSLVLQKASIVIGALSLLTLSRWLSFRPCNVLASSSFFVYLTHEFPLREVLLRISGTILPPRHAFWLAAPAAVVICFVAARLSARYLPVLSNLLTGGRSQRHATSNVSSNPSNPAAGGNPLNVRSANHSRLAMCDQSTRNM